MDTSIHKPQYERICALHASVRTAKTGFQSAIDSFYSVDDQTDLESREHELHRAFEHLKSAIDTYETAMCRLQRKVEKMSTDTNDQKRDSKMEGDIFKEFQSGEEDDLEFDQTHLQGPFIISMRAKMTSTIDDAITRVTNRIKIQSIRTSTSISTNSAENQHIQPTTITNENDLATIITRLMEKSYEVPLPSITLIPFDGESTQWESFYSQYTSLIECKSHLSDHAKLVYLRNAITGPALRTIDGIPIEGRNLQPTIDRLKSVYGRSKRSNTILISQLFSIRPKSTSFEDQLECTQHLISKIHQLDDKSLVDNFALINQIAGTIHSNHLEKMYREEPNTMMEALYLIESDLRERIEISKLKSTFRSTTRSDNLGNQNQKNHKPVTEHTNIKAFGPNQSSITATVNTSQPVNCVARLFTTPACLQNPETNKSATRHVLLDTGGMMSFISRSLANELKLKSHRTETMNISGVGGESTGSDVHDVVKVEIMTSKGNHSIEALVMDTVITRSMHLNPLSADDYAVVKSHCGNQEHLTENTIVTPDLLISVTETQDLLINSTTVALPSGFKLVQSVLGPMITGRANSRNSSIGSQNIPTRLITDAPWKKDPPDKWPNIPVPSISNPPYMRVIGKRTELDPSQTIANQATNNPMTTRAKSRRQAGGHLPQFDV